MSQPRTKLDSDDAKKDLIGPKLSIVIPAFNEADAIESVLSELEAVVQDLGQGDTIEIVVVDDGSTDGTADRVRCFPDVKLLRHRVNRGYGAALKTGFRAARGEVVVTMDSDGQHVAGEIEKLLEAMDEADMVVGERVQARHSPLWRWPGKLVLGWIANLLAGRRIPDLNSGFRAIKREVARKYLHLCPEGFSFSTTLTLALICQGYAVRFVPVQVRRRNPQSKSTVTLHTGFQTLLLVLRLITLFGPLKLFLPTSMVLLLVGALWGGRYILMGKGLSITGLLLILTGVLVFFFGLLADQIAALRREKYE